MKVFPQVAYGLADAGGGGDGGGQHQQQGGGQGDQGGGGAGQGQQQGGGQQQAWAPPKDVVIDPQYLGTSAEETLGKLAKGFTELNTRAEGLRQDLSRRGTAPAKPEEYTFNPGEKIASYFGADPSKNPGLAMARTAAHKHGLTDAQFNGIINDVYGPMAEQGLLAAPYDAKAEITRYGSEHGLNGDAINQQLKENEAFANGLIGQLEGIPEKLKADASAELKALTDTAGGQALLRAMMGRMAKAGIIVVSGEGKNTGPLTDAEARALTSDPRIDPRNENHKDPAQRYDPELRRQYTEAMQRIGQSQQQSR